VTICGKGRIWNWESTSGTGSVKAAAIPFGSFARSASVIGVFVNTLPRLVICLLPSNRLFDDPRQSQPSTFTSNHAYLQRQTCFSKHSKHTHGLWWCCNTSISPYVHPNAPYPLHFSFLFFYFTSTCYGVRRNCLCFFNLACSPTPSLHSRRTPASPSPPPSTSLLVVRPFSLFIPSPPPFLSCCVVSCGHVLPARLSRNTLL
jgi:hypothetical protein